MPKLWDGGFGEVDVRRVQPYQATKKYVCPGCHRDIPPATGHYVAVPELAPELRRHWHYACWDRRVPVPVERARRTRTPPRSLPRRRP